MKFSVNQPVLSRALNDANRALPLKSEKTLLENIQILANEDGLILTASDGNMTVTSHARATVEEGGEVLVPGKLFTDMVRKLPPADAICSLNDHMVMNIRCGSMKANISCSNMDYPEVQDLSHIAPVHMESKMVGEMISKVAFAVSLQDARPMLTGINMEITPDEVRLVALDGFRLALQKRRCELILPQGIEKIAGVIPGRVMNVMREIIDASEEKVMTLRIGKESISVLVGETELQSPLLVGEFMNYRAILPTEFKYRVKVNRIQLQEAVGRASLIAQDGKNNLIKFHSEGNILKITSNSESGDDLEELPVDEEGESFLIAFNSRYLNDVLRNLDDEEIVMNMNSSVSPCVISSAVNGNYVYLLLPIRIYGN